MNIRISQNERSCFVGEVFPLWLEGDVAPEFADVKWTCRGAKATLRVYRDREGVSRGALVTPLECGELSIVAECAAEKYIAAISVRGMKHTESGRMNYYLADLHDHTTMIHVLDDYVKNGGNSQGEYVDFMLREGGIDLSVISDHGDVIDDWAFFRGFIEADRTDGADTLILAGSESEISLIEKDRFGFTHKNSGEIVILNGDNYTAVKTYGEFYDRLETSPYAICTLAHPQVIGYGSTGVWNFSLDKHREDGFANYVKLVEMGNGSLRGSNNINEFVYSVALDNGFRVSTTCSSDQHEAPWGAVCFPGKTVVMAPEKSREAFIDALRSGRCYCSDSGNVKVYCEVNGKPLPADLDPAESYKFHVELDYFRELPETEIVLCEVISDYGRCVATVGCEGKRTFEIEVKAPSARWFYLRLIDAECNKTLTPAAYTGRAYDPVEKRELHAFDKKDMKAVDLLTEGDASILLSGNPDEYWESALGRAEIVIDMGEERELSALGHYPRRILRWAGTQEGDLFATLVAEYEVAVSQDGASYVNVASGLIRVYGGEVVISFAPVTARYVKFIAKNNVGAFVKYDCYKGLPIVIGELSPGVMR